MHVGAPDGVLDSTDNNTDGIDAESEERTMGELISRTLIEGSRPEFLVPFLETYKGYCERRGVPLDPRRAERDAEEWVGAIHRLLNDSTDDDRPRPLSAAVAAVVRLSDVDGYERLVDALDGIDPRPRLPERTTHFELALWAYETHPVAFEIASRRKQADARQNFWEYLPKRFKPLVGAASEDAKGALMQLLAQHHDDLGHTRYAALDVSTERPYETRILWGHGRATKTEGMITDEIQRKSLRFTPDRWDMTVIDHATGRLAINAESDKQRTFLREVLGRVFFADEDHYSKRTIYSGRPLLERGAASLSTAGIAGLREVQLRSVRVHYGDEGVTETYDTGERECLFRARAKRLREASGRRDAFITSMKLAVVYAHSGRERSLEIDMPNHVVVFDRRVAERPIREFLVTRGFADYGGGDPGGWTLAAA